MCTIKRFVEKYKKAYNELPEAIFNTVQQISDVLLDLNKDQLLQGRDADGNILTPGYLQDDYFPTSKMAQAYLRKKIRLEQIHWARMRFLTGIELYPGKNENTPNLIVTGPFHDGFFIKATKGSFDKLDAIGEYTIDSSYEDADDINSKYKGRVYGHAPRSKAFIYFTYIRPTIERVYRQ